MASKIPFVIREATKDDINFIYASWLESFRYDSDLGKSHRNSIFFSEYRKVLDHILARHDVKVAIGAIPESPEAILTYLVYEPEHKVIHWVYTKGPFRRLGLARELITLLMGNEKEITTTHKTLTAEKILGFDNPRFIHNAISLFQKGET